MIVTLSQRDVDHFVAEHAECRRSSVSFKATQATTLWYGVREGDALVAVAGLLCGATYSRLRGDYTLAAHRGKGYHTALTERRLREAARRGLRVEVITQRPDYYRRFGLRELGPAPHGNVRCGGSPEP